MFTAVEAKGVASGRRVLAVLTGLLRPTTTTTTTSPPAAAGSSPALHPIDFLLAESDFDSMAKRHSSPLLASAPRFTFDQALGIICEVLATHLDPSVAAFVRELNAKVPIYMLAPLHHSVASPSSFGCLGLD
jgi:hypothetical protein